MVRKKSGSKRMSLKLKYTIKKKVKAHKKKLRRYAKHNPSLTKRPKKDPGIPNLWPFKEQLLEQMERQRARITEEQARQRDERRKRIEKNRKEQARLLREREQQGLVATSSSSFETGKRMSNTGMNRKKWFMKELTKVVEAADIILEVVDARDPIGCRAPRIETLIQGKLSAQAVRPKKIILVLNKIDLVPAEVTDRWVKYLSREFPVVAFKASTQKQGRGLGQTAMAAKHVSKHTASSVGVGALMNLIKQYSMSQKLKTAVCVGVIGYPNVGKSSIINSLKRSRVASVGSKPGHTKNIQRIRLDKHVELLDSPGVLFAADEQSETDLVLRNCIKVEKLEDPVAAAYAVINRCNKMVLLSLYHTADYTAAEQFLYMLGLKRGKLKKGGVPNLVSAAEVLLHDWVDGKIPYYTTPPTVNSSTVSQATAVSSWGKEFDIDALLDSNAEVLKEVASAQKQNPSGSFMEVESLGPSRVQLVEDDMGDDTKTDMDMDDNNNNSSNPLGIPSQPFQFQMDSVTGNNGPPTSSSSSSNTDTAGQSSSDLFKGPNQRRMRGLQRKQKASRKARQKEQKLLMDSLQDEMDGDDAMAPAKGGGSAAASAGGAGMDEDNDAYDFTEHW